MFQGLGKVALPTVAAAALIAMATTSSPAFTLSAPSLDKPTASNIEQAYWVRGWGWHRPWGWGYGYRPWGWGYRYGWHHPWGYRYGWHHPWGYRYGWHRPWGWGYRYGWRHPWGYWG